MKIYNKFVESKKEPSNKNDIWFDGSSWKMYKEGLWRAFTLPLDAAERLVKMLEEFKLFKIVSSLPQVGENNIIYLIENVDSVEGNSLIEYIYINNKWEEIGKFTPELKLDDYLKIEDSPFEKGDAENSVVLKGGSNTASAQYSIAFGINTISSNVASYAEGAPYNNICTESKGQASHAEGAGTKSLADGAHSEGVLTTSGRDSDRNAIIAGSELGILGTNEELVVKLRGYGAHAEGYGTKALGTSSHAEGNSTQALANSSHAEGDSTIAYGEASHAEGYLTEAKGNQSHAGGKYTVTEGNSSFAHGDHLETNNVGESAFGRFNKSNRGGNDTTRTVHSIGIGSEIDGRKNAHEIMKDGKHYIIGIGGYDGTNPTTAKSVQEVINELVNKLNEITTND